MEIFKLFGTIMVDNEKANQSISKTEQKAEGLGTKLGSAMKTAGKWGLAIGAGAVAVGGAIGALVVKTSEAADEIDKLSERTGISREELQRWKYAAGQSGADIGKLEVGIKKLSDVMDGAVNGSKTNIAAFDKLGISLDDLKSKSQEDIFSQVMDALAEMPQGAERNALGNDLLGKSYTEMLPLLNAGADGMKELRDRADDLGLVMSEENVKANVKFGDSLSDLKQAFSAIFMHISNEFLPAINKGVDFILEHMPEIQKTIGGVFKVVGTAVSMGTKIFEALMPILKILYDFVSWAFPKIAKVVEVTFGVVGAVVGSVADAFGWVVDKVKAAYEWLTKWNDKDVKKKKVEVESVDDDRNPKPTGSDKPKPSNPKPKPGGSHASGLAYVPYDGYIAELHKGERVLSRGEAWQAQTVIHTGTITVKGVNDRNQVVAVVDIVMDELRRGLRR